MSSLSSARSILTLYDSDKIVEQMRGSSWTPRGTNWVDRLLENMAKRPLVREETINRLVDRNCTATRLYVLACLAGGLTALEIAKQEGCQEQVIEKRIQRIIAVLSAKNETHAVAIAIRKGLL